MSPTIRRTFVLAALAASACNLPRDPEGALDRDLDFVIDRFTTSTPWKQQVAPGENAWQVRVERVLRGKKNQFPALRRARAE